MCLSLLGCILLATLDTKTSYVYIFRCAHKFIVQKWRNSTGKMVEDNHGHQTQIFEENKNKK